ncbi:MAG TPA: biotin transporter BioY, partial [Lacunisphaera sp.]|nr:biotin transporter BioY [Lacunisphaera sp.]
MQTNTAGAALAPTLLSNRADRALQELALVLAGTLVLYISAKVFVPFFPVPMTLQTLAVMAIAAAYGQRLGTLTVLAYLAEG